MRSVCRLHLLAFHRLFFGVPLCILRDDRSSFIDKEKAMQQVAAGLLAVTLHGVGVRYMFDLVRKRSKQS